MNFRLTAIMLLFIGATEAITLTKDSGPVVAGDASTVVEGATEGIAEAKSFVGLGVRFTDMPVANGVEAVVSSTANEGLTDARTFNQRNSHSRSMADKEQHEFLKE